MLLPLVSHVNGPPESPVQESVPPSNPAHNISLVIVLGFVDFLNKRLHFRFDNIGTLACLTQLNFSFFSCVSPQPAILQLLSESFSRMFPCTGRHAGLTKPDLPITSIPVPSPLRLILIRAMSCLTSCLSFLLFHL